MTNGSKQSDSAIVPLRAANKRTLVPAESTEGRAGTKPVGKRVDRTLRRIGAELRRRMHHNPYEVAKWLGKILNGWLRYYAVPTSSRFLERFAFRLRRMWLRALRRRSQMDRTKLDKLGKYAEVSWPTLKVLHPWPEKRFAVTYPR